jgi:hypothetical protein
LVSASVIGVPPAGLVPSVRAHARGAIVAERRPRLVTGTDAPVPSSPPEGTTTVSDARIGIIGFGLRSSLSTYAHRPGEGSVVVAVCDTDERGRTDVAAELGDDVLRTDDLGELLAQGLDGVLVLTPDDLHAEHAVRTLEAGVATFLEKPLAITIEDCDRILETAHRTGTRLYVGHNMRHIGAPPACCCRRARTTST